jgi:hypothetical protein
MGEECISKPEQVRKSKPKQRPPSVCASVFLLKPPQPDCLEKKHQNTETYYLASNFQPQASGMAQKEIKEEA